MIGTIACSCKSAYLRVPWGPNPNPKGLNNLLGICIIHLELDDPQSKATALSEERL